MKEPRWLSRIVIDAIHANQLREHGGLSGIRDENALESALARAQNKWEYSQKTDIAALAAAYAFGISGSHPYRDGNKRIAFLAMAVFLGLNGHSLTATEPEVYTAILALADNKLSEEQLADWIRQHTHKVKRVSG